MPTRTSLRLAAAIAGAALTFGTAAMAADGNREQGEDRVEINALLGAHTSPADAIKAAEAKTGGRAVAFGLEDNDGTVAYHVRVAQADGLRRVSVDPATGIATAAPAGSGHSVQPEAMASSDIPLAAAVSAAEQQAGGRALEARGTIANGQRAYEVQVARADVVNRVTVSAADGRVLLVARAENTRHGEHEDAVD